MSSTIPGRSGKAVGCGILGLNTTVSVADSLHFVCYYQYYSTTYQLGDGKVSSSWFSLDGVSQDFPSLLLEELPLTTGFS